MFDFAWSELALIGAVALLAIGPKDMPMAIKSVAGLVKKARRMAGEFQTHVDDLMKEADLGEMRGHLGELRSFNLRQHMEKAVDPDGALRATLMNGAPLASGSGTVAEADPVDSFVGVRSHYGVAAPAYASPWAAPKPDHLRPGLDDPPAFIPPEAVACERALRAAPAFIPPADAGPRAA